MGNVVVSRRQFLKAGVSLAACATLAGCSALPVTRLSPAQQIAKLPRIGYLAYAINSRPLFYVREGLRNLGYVENESFTVELRYSDYPDELTKYAADLVDLRVNIILAADTPSIRAAQQATDAIPIVMLTSADPIGNGFIKSLARPGGNITGLTQNKALLSAKRLGLLTEVSSSISRVAMLWDPNDQGTASQWQESQHAAEKLGIHLDSLEVRRVEDIASALGTVTQGSINALLPLSGLAISRQPDPIVDAAIELRLPAMFDDRSWVDAGGLMSYGPSSYDQFRRSGTYIEKILKGARPADLPVELPTAIDFVVNQRTARAIGLSFPRSIWEQVTEIV